MAYPKHRAPTSLSGESVGVFLCVPVELLPHVRGALWGLQYNYAYVPGVGDIEASRNAFVEMVRQVDMACCDAVADCITSSDGVQGALASAVTGFILSGALDEVLGDIAREAVRGRTEVPVVLNNNPSIVESCDRDILFGVATGVFDTLDALCMDILQIFEASTNLIEIAGDFAGAIPILGALPEGLLDAVNTIQESVQENYEAGLTIALRNRVRCALMCAAVVDCELTFADVLGWYREEVGSQALPGLVDVLTFFDGMALSGELVVTGLHWLVLESLAFGSSVAGVSPDMFLALVAASRNDPDPDHAILCDKCETSVCYTFDTGSIPTIAYGSIVSSVGNPAPSLESVFASDLVPPPYASSQNFAYRRAASVTHVFTEPVAVASVSMDVLSSFIAAGRPLGFTGVAVSLHGGDGGVLYNNVYTATYPDWNRVTWEGNWSNVSEVRVAAFVNTGASGATGEMWIDNVCVDYTEA